MHWIFLILAAVCEMLWFYCIAYLNKYTFNELISLSFLEEPNGWWTVASIAGYAILGVANMVLFAKAIQKIVPSIAFAVWTGLALAGITLSDGLIRNIPFSWTQITSICLIILGVIGLKFLSKKEEA